MALRLYAEIGTSRGLTWRINIHDADYSGSAIEFNVAPPGMELQWSGGQDVFSPLMPSTCVVPMIVDSVAESSLLLALSDFEEGRFVLEVRRDPDGNNSRHWIGIFTPESILIPDEAKPFVVDLKAVCGLSLLSRKQYDTTLQIAGIENSVLDHIQNSIRAIPGSTSSTFFPIVANMFCIPVDVVPDTGTATDNFAEDVYLQAVTNDIFQGQNSIGSYEEMLVQLCTMMNARLYMWEGRWMFEPVARKMGAGSTLNNCLNYDRNGSYLSNSTLYTGFTIDQSNRHRMGGSFHFLPAIRKITRTINYFGNAPYAGDTWLGLSEFTNVGNSASSLDQQLTISSSADVTLPSTQKLRVKGLCRVEVPWFDGYLPGTTNYQPQERLQRFLLEIKVQLGTKYLRRAQPHALTYVSVPEDELYAPAGETNQQSTIFEPAPEGAYTWSSDSSHRVQMWSEVLVTGGQEWQYIPRNAVIPFDFTTPEVGSAEDADLTIELKVKFYHGEATGANPDAYVSSSVHTSSTIARADVSAWLGDGSDMGDAITFGAELNTDATEELEILPGLYAEATDNNNLHFYNPAALLTASNAIIDGFKSDTTTAQTPLAELLCIDRLQHMGTQQECWQGVIQSELYITPWTLLAFDSKSWMITQLSYSAQEDLYDVECTKVSALGSLSPSSVSSVIKPLNVVDQVGSGFDSVVSNINRGRKDLMSITADIEDDVAALQTDVTDLQSDVVAINRTTDAQGGDSSVQLQYLGDVKISSPADGQVLEYNTTAGRWANVTPSSGGASSLPDLDDVNSSITPAGGDLLVWTTANGGEWNTNSVPVAIGSQLNAGNLGNVTEGTGTAGNILLDYALGGGAYWITTALSTACTSYVDLTDLKDVTAPSPSDGDALQWSSAASAWQAAPVPSYETKVHSFFTSDANGDLVPFGGTLSETTSPQYYLSFHPPYNGYLLKAYVMCTSSAAGSSTLSLRRYTGFSSYSTIKSVTATISGSYSAQLFDFTAGGPPASFSAGNWLALFFDPTGTPSGVTITTLWQINSI